MAFRIKDTKAGLTVSSGDAPSVCCVTERQFSETALDIAATVASQSRPVASFTAEVVNASRNR